ncbi:MAG: Xaa-Pro peptidase family protein [Candidatus Zixiibacteriota bacterium]
MSTSRINELRAKCRAANLDAIIVTNMEQVRYLTGFSGDSGMLVLSGHGAEFLTDFRFTDQAKKQVRGARVSIVTGDLYVNLKEVAILKGRNQRVGFCGDHLSVTNRDKLAANLPEALPVNADSLFAEMGWVKDTAELTNIRKAVEISDTVFRRILELVRPGVRENELAAEMEYQMMMLGSEKPAFDTIVASGYRAAMPHGVASAKRLEKGDFVTFDFGARVNGFVSDITRTVVVGKATPRQKKIYGIVLKAQLAGIRRVRAGVAAKAVDEACRSLIKKAGYGKEFGHGTGHGIGFFIHMGPRVSAISKDKLKPNNVITIEPGIYISGWGGVRIEDDVLVTRTGGKVLNRAPKNLLEL